MKITVSESYAAQAKQVVEDLISLLKEVKAPLLCTASGDSTANLYAELVRRVQQEQLDVRSWHFVGLDEWAGMNGKDEGSCRFYLDRQLFWPLKITADKICFFDGCSTNALTECQQIEAFLHERGGIDVAIVGLGMNGHVGMNEPGTSPLLRAHETLLDPVTQQVGQKYFKQPRQLTGGITLGIANLLEARQIFLVVNGSHKASVVGQLLHGAVSTGMPASLLLAHEHLNIYLDREAAALVDGGRLPGA